MKLVSGDQGMVQRLVVAMTARQHMQEVQRLQAQQEERLKDVLAAATGADSGEASAAGKGGAMSTPATQGATGKAKQNVTRVVNLWRGVVLMRTLLVVDIS